MSQLEMRIIQTILRESKKAEKQSKKKEKDSPDEPIKTVKIKVGETEWDNFPASEAKRVINLVRQIVRGTVDSLSIIDSLVDQAPEGKREKLRKVLEEIQKEHGDKIITLIPESFPFLAADGEESFDLTSLGSDSNEFLNLEQGTTGRGEVAIALLFGVEEFLNPTEKGQKKSSVSSYDLVYKGGQCDVKDARTMLKDGNMKLENYVRLGGVASREIEISTDIVLDEFGIYLPARDFFANQTNCAEPLAYLVMNSQDIESPDVLFNACKSLLEDIVAKTDEIIQAELKKKYPGGIFIITFEKIKLYKPSEFKMYALKGEGRCSIEYVDSEDKLTYFMKGALKHLDRSKVSLFEEYRGKKASPAPEEPEEEEAPPEEEPEGED
jgi:hypothetical protein